MIIGFFGTKQAGKNTCANIIVGDKLKKLGMIQDFTINDEGKLIVKTSNKSGDVGWGEFDVSRKDYEFMEWAGYNMWPYVKLYSFADELKKICIELFDIPERCVYGTDEQKNTIIPHLLWENMPGVTEEKLTKGPMTSREFMQFFGTEIMRKIWGPVWINNTINKILREQSELSIITDVRFENELDAINSIGGNVIKLSRNKFKSTHASELDIYKINNDKFFSIIDNGADDYTINLLMRDVLKIYNDLC